MIAEFFDMLSYPFILRALITGILVSLCSSLLGVTLVLKRYSMIGDGLSHVGFGALAIAAALGFAPLFIAIPVVVISAFLLLRLNRNSKIKGDSATAMISAAALAAGVCAVSVTGTNIDLSSYLFGSILSLSDTDVILSILLAAAVILIFVFTYPKIFAVAFDETFAKATGVNAGFFSSVIAVLTAVTVVLGMRMMGTLLISSIIIFPPLSAMRLFKTFKSVTVCSALFSVLAFVTGLFISCTLRTPTGATVVLVNALIMIVCSVIKLVITKTKKRSEI